MRAGNHERETKEWIEMCACLMINAWKVKEWNREVKGTPSRRGGGQGSLRIFFFPAEENTCWRHGDICFSNETGLNKFLNFLSSCRANLQVSCFPTTK